MVIFTVAIAKTAPLEVLDAVTSLRDFPRAGVPERRVASFRVADPLGTVGASSYYRRAQIPKFCDNGRFRIVAPAKQG